MVYTTYLYDDILVISLKGDVLGSSFEDEILSVFKIYISFKVVKCILDFTNVKHMNSSGLSFIIRSYNIFQQAGGGMVILRPSHHIQKLFAITKLRKICDIAHSKREGVQLLKK